MKNDIKTHLKEIRDRVEAATPGPWTTEGKLGDFYVCFFEIVDNNIKSAIYAPNATDIQMWNRNAPLIAHAPTDITRLLAAVEVLSEALERLEANKLDEERPGLPYGTTVKQECIIALATATQILTGEKS